MDILEKELEDMIWHKMDNGYLDSLEDKGLTIDYDAKFYRQYNFGAYGIADLVSLSIVKDKRRWLFYVNIYELKKDEINYKTLNQAMRYAKAVERMADDWNYRYKKRRPIVLSISIHLIGKKCVGSAFMYLPDLFKNLYLYEYKFDFDEGISFEQKLDYHLSEETPISFPNLREVITLDIQ